MVTEPISISMCINTHISQTKAESLFSFFLFFLLVGKTYPRYSLWAWQHLLRLTKKPTRSSLRGMWGFGVRVGCDEFLYLKTLTLISLHHTLVSLATTDGWVKVRQHLRKVFLFMAKVIWVSFPGEPVVGREGARKESSRLVSTSVCKRPQVYRMSAPCTRQINTAVEFVLQSPMHRSRLDFTQPHRSWALSSLLLTSLPRRFLIRASPQYIMCIWIFVSSSASRGL